MFQAIVIVIVMGSPYISDNSNSNSNRPFKYMTIVIVIVIGCLNMK